VRRRAVEVVEGANGVRQVRDQMAIAAHVPGPDAWWLEQ
jgi:hypothetical protein